MPLPMLAVAALSLSSPRLFDVGRRQVVLAAASVTSLPRPPAASAAVAAASADLGDKLLNLPPARIAEIVRADLVERQFLATAAFTREIYDESALFTDEIDTYTLPKFIKGTSALFVADKSFVKVRLPIVLERPSTVLGSRALTSLPSAQLVGDVEATAAKVSFRFDEDLCFNIPFQPIVTVTGRCELTRDPQTGLITQYREFWDKSPTEVVLTAFQKRPQR